MPCSEDTHPWMFAGHTRDECGSPPIIGGLDSHQTHGARRYVAAAQMAGTSEYYDGLEARGIDANLRISFVVRIEIVCELVLLVLYLRLGGLQILAVLVDVSCIPAEAQSLR